MRARGASLQALVPVIVVAVVLAGCFERGPPTTTHTAGYRGPFQFGLGVQRIGGEPNLPEPAEDLARLDTFMSSFQEQRMKSCGAQAPFGGGYQAGLYRGNDIVNVLATCWAEGEDWFIPLSEDKEHRRDVYEELVKRANHAADKVMAALRQLNNSADLLEAELQGILHYKTVQFLQGLREEEGNANSVNRGTLSQLVLYQVFFDAAADFVAQYPWKGETCNVSAGLVQRLGDDLRAAREVAERVIGEPYGKRGGYGRGSPNGGELNQYTWLYNASVENGWLSGLLIVESGVSLNLAYWRSFPNGTLPTLQEAKILFDNKMAQRWSLTDSALLKTEVADLTLSLSRPAVAKLWEESSVDWQVARTMMVLDQMVWSFGDPCAVR